MHLVSMPSVIPSRAPRLLKSCQLAAWLCLMTCVSLFLLLPQLAATDLPTTNLTASETSHHFGRVRQGVTVSHDFTLKNGGASPIRITNVLFKGPLTTAKVKNDIFPGQEGKITLILETAGLKGEVAAGAVLVTDDPRQPRVELTLLGQVLPPVVEFVPFQAFFLSTFQGEPKEQTATIINHADKPLDILGVDTESKRFQADLRTITPGKEFQLTVKVIPAASVGRSLENLLLFTNNPEFQEIKVPVNVFIKGDVYHVPDLVNFVKFTLASLNKALKNSPQKNKLLTQTILVKRKPGRGKDFKIKVQHDIPFIKILKTPDSGSETYRLDITPIIEKMKPAKIDTFIKVKTNDKEVPELKIPVVGEVLWGFGF
jgi:Protein of unknown function (DUF1573)